MCTTLDHLMLVAINIAFKKLFQSGMSMEEKRNIAFVGWMGLNQSHDTWEPEENLLEDCPTIVWQFESAAKPERIKRREVMSMRGTNVNSEDLNHHNGELLTKVKKYCTF